MKQSIHKPAMRAHQGFSLVELMISMVLGLLLSAAAIQMFLTSQQSMNLQKGTSDVQESGRYALDFLMRDIRKAGMRPASAAAVANPITGTAGTTGTSPVLGTSGTTGDSITVTYIAEAAAGAPDCNGVLVPGVNPTIVNIYSISGNSLRCQGNGTPASGPIELVSGIDGFKVLYGIDTTVNGIPSVNRWVPTIPAGAVVVAVQVGLLIHSETRVTGMPAPNPLNLLGRATYLSSDANYNDGRLRRMFVSSTLLRNSLDPSVTTF